MEDGNMEDKPKYQFQIMRAKFCNICHRKIHFGEVCDECERLK
jgi:hypothetical protein